LPLRDAIAYLEDYAAAFRPPLRLGIEVERLERNGDGGFAVRTSAGTLEAANVVVATGAFQKPRRLLQTGAQIIQLHTSEYRRPEQLPDAAVLVVGSGQSGCQIAEELLRAGKDVDLSIGRCPWAPRRYRGRDLVHWMIDLGLMERRWTGFPPPMRSGRATPR
jgi:putative flavoprotein involved in K+ transport